MRPCKEYLDVLAARTLANLGIWERGAPKPYDLKLMKEAFADLLVEAGLLETEYRPHSTVNAPSAMTGPRAHALREYLQEPNGTKQAWNVNSKMADTLRRAGWVREATEYQVRKATTFQITDEGRAALAKWEAAR